MRAVLYSLRRSPAAEAVRAMRSALLRSTTKATSVGTPKISQLPRFLSDQGQPTFFGYHDKTPFSGDGRKILGTSIALSDTRPENECTQMQVGYFPADMQAGTEFVRLTTTTTWSWQQGCMLQWNPGNPAREIVFNSLVDGVYGSVLLDCSDGSIVRQFSAPIYSMDPAGRFASTLNFSRLGRLRPGYGYHTLADSTLGDTAPENDGLFLLDMRSGEKSLLVSLATLAAQVRQDSSEHYVNHATFSPDGKYLVFFHIWTRAQVNLMRVCAIKIDTGECFAIETERVVSHYCWRSEEELLATTREPSGKWHYTLYSLSDLSRRDLGLPLDADGHPMFHPSDKDIVITDTYPDRRRDQHLCVVNVRTAAVEEVATLYSPFRYRGQVRCDLHPRWDRAGRCVAVDTTSRGRRELAVVQVHE